MVSMRFGLTDGQPKTLGEIGKVYGVTRERIRQIESTTMSKLRHPSRSKVLRDYLDLTGGRQPRDVTSDPRPPARGRTECLNLDGRRRDRHRAEVRAERRISRELDEESYHDK